MACRELEKLMFPCILFRMWLINLTVINNLNTFTKDLREGALEMKMVILQF